MIPHCDSFLPLYELKNLWIWNSADMTKLENIEEVEKAHKHLLTRFIGEASEMEQVEIT